MDIEGVGYTLLVILLEYSKYFGSQTRTKKAFDVGMIVRTKDQPRIEELGLAVDISELHRHKFIIVRKSYLIGHLQVKYPQLISSNVSIF